MNKMNKKIVLLFIGMYMLIGLSLVELSFVNAGIITEAGYNNCYQEFANVSTSCGGKSTGQYRFIFHDNWINKSNLFDGNNNTYAYINISSNTTMFYIDYHKPNFALNTSKINYFEKDGFGDRFYNQYNITDDCWNLGDYLELLITQTYNSSLIDKYNTTLWCNGASETYNLLFTRSTQAIESNYRFTEESMSWIIPNLIENSQTYNNITLLKTNENFILNITSQNIIQSIILVYNNTNYSVDSIISEGSNYYTISKTLTTPDINISTNISFYWIITINGTSYNTSINNQTIKTLELTTNCAGNYYFMNITNYDEENLLPKSATVEYLINIKNNGNILNTINGNITGYNISLCSTENLSSYSNIYDLQLRYYNNGYFYKSYNIVNSAISNLPISINLYNLNDSLGTRFKINYEDFYYLKYPNAIIQIQRQYLNENIYRTVEIPKLDANGATTASFNTNNIRYKLIVINNGEILDTFDNIFPSCQNIILGTCEINLRGAKPIDESTEGDFTYTLIKTNNSLILTYIIPSGTPRTIQLLTNQNSRFLNNISTCDTSLFASGGTLTCYFNQTVGDSIVDLQIVNSDGSNLYGSVFISEDLGDFFLLNNYFIAFVLMLLLGLIFVSSGVLIVVVSVVGIIFLGLIFLLKGASLFTIAGSIGWLIIGAVLIIYKIATKEEKT